MFLIRMWLIFLFLSFFSLHYVFIKIMFTFMYGNSCTIIYNSTFSFIGKLGDQWWVQPFFYRYNFGRFPVLLFHFVALHDQPVLVNSYLIAIFAVQGTHPLLYVSHGKDLSPQRSVHVLAFSSISEENLWLSWSFSAFAVPHETTIVYNGRESISANKQRY